MKHFKFLFFSMFFLLACKNNKIPADIIPKDKMILLLIDMHYTDSYFNRTLETDSTLARTKALYQFIFKKYKTDSIQFKNSFNYYNQHPELLDEIYESMIDSVTKRQTIISKQDLLKRNKELKKADTLKKNVDSLIRKNFIEKKIQDRLKKDRFKKPVL